MANPCRRQQHLHHKELFGFQIHHDLGKPRVWRVGALQVLEVLQQDLLGDLQPTLQAARLRQGDSEDMSEAA